MIHLSVVVPCYNEQDSIPALVPRLLAVFDKSSINGQIVLVNDASTDNTAAIAESLAKTHSNISVVHHAVNKGLSAGWKSGLQAATGQFVCFIDADLQNPPEEIKRLYREILQSNVDMVQGVRSSIGRLKNSRLWLSRGLNILLNTMFGMRAIDNKSGFVIARRETMIDITTHEKFYHYFHTFIHVAAVAKGYTVKEVETLFQDRRTGQSYIAKFPFKLVIYVLLDCVKAFIEFRLRKNKSSDLLENFLSQNPPLQEPTSYKGWRKLLFDFYFITMPLHTWMITRRTKYYYKLLKRSEYLSHENMRKLQETKLCRLIQHAYLHVPYYRACMQERGLAPEDIVLLEDLNKLPLLSKKDLRENLYFDLFSDTHKKSSMLKISTSGSTGEPLVTYADRKQLEMRFASTLRSMEWTGWQFGDRQARLWHQTIGMSFIQVLREKIDAYLMRRLFIPAYEIRENNIDHFLSRLRRHKPVLIDGYAESFNFLAYYAERANVQGIRPKAIMSSAQILPEQTRHKIEKSYHTKVFDKYGSREFSGIAYECCEHNGHHIVSESYIVEILKDNRPAEPGEIGEVVITDLNNLSVPLIRYRIGDLAVAVDNSIPCPCGRGLPLIGRIEGRAQSIIIGTNGVWLPGTFFAHFFKDYEHAIRQYQVVQHKHGAIDLRIIKSDLCSEQITAEIIQGLKHYLGEDMTIELFFVQEIPLIKTGKRVPVISYLNYDFQLTE